MTSKNLLDSLAVRDTASIVYLGQEGILIRYAGCTLVIDPYLTDYVDRNCCTKTVKWVRCYPAPFTPEEIAFADYILCTHAHYDHADPDTLTRIARANPSVKFVVPQPMKEKMHSYGIEENRVIGVKADIGIECGAFHVIPVPAAHETLRRDENGDYAELGYRVHFGNRQIFHAGDCCVYDGLEERIQNMDIVFLPVNGRSYFKNREDIIGNMTAEEAVDLACRTGAGMFVPLHFDLYDTNGVNPAVFVDAISTLAPGLPYHIFKPGEMYILDC